MRQHRKDLGTICKEPKTLPAKGYLAAFVESSVEVRRISELGLSKVRGEEESEHFARLFFTILGNDERYRERYLIFARVALVWASDGHQLDGMALYLQVSSLISRHAGLSICCTFYVTMACQPCSLSDETRNGRILKEMM